jgi:hypothetical protein
MREINEPTHKPVVKLSKDADLFAAVAGAIAALWDDGQEDRAVTILLGWFHVGNEQSIIQYLERFVTFENEGE